MKDYIKLLKSIPKLDKEIEKITKEAKHLIPTLTWLKPRSPHKKRVFLVNKQLTSEYKTIYRNFTLVNVEEFINTA